MRLSLLPLFLACGLAAPVFASETAMSDFRTALDATLKKSQEAKRGVVFHVNGASIPGVVKEIYGDTVVVANQQHGRILIRIERIDAVEAD